MHRQRHQLDRRPRPRRRPRLVLIAASGLAFLLDERIEGLAILAVIFLNATIGFFTELRADRR